MTDALFSGTRTYDIVCICLTVYFCSTVLILYFRAFPTIAITKLHGSVFVLLHFLSFLLYFFLFIVCIVVFSLFWVLSFVFLGTTTRSRTLVVIGFGLSGKCFTRLELCMCLCFAQIIAGFLTKDTMNVFEPLPMWKC